MRRRFLLCLLSSVLLLDALAETSFAGPQKDAVCQGSCGGGCGPCPVGGNEGDGRGSLAGIGEWLALPFTILNGLIPTQPNGPSPDQALNDKGIEAFNRGDWVTAASFFKKALEINPNNTVFHKNLAYAENHSGEEAYAKGDYIKALEYCQQAAENVPVGDPGERVIRSDLAATRDRIAEAQRAQEKRLQDQIVATNMQQSIQELSQKISASSSEGGLSFMDGSPGGNPNLSKGAVNGVLSKKTSSPSALEFMGAGSPVPIQAPSNDPMVVDARNVPTGLPKSVEANIPDTPAGNRVRKGFQAIMDHDWNAAHAWFQDALNHDPGNAGLQRLVDLADFSMKRAKTAPPDKPANNPAVDTTAQDNLAMETLDRELDRQFLASALKDFNTNYKPSPPPIAQVSAQPAAQANSRSAQKQQQQKAGWQAFFDAIFTKPNTHVPPSLLGVRD